MALDGRTILAVSLNRKVCEYLGQVLSTPDFDLRFATDVTHAQELTEKEVFDVILIEYPAPGSNLQDFLKILRTTMWASNEAAVILLTPPESLEHAEALQVTGVTRILNLQASPERLRQNLEQLFDHEKRYPVHGLLRINGEQVGLVGTIMAQTDNLSCTGMLVRCDKPIAIGSRFSFTLELPGTPNPLCGSAAVVRYSRAGVERVMGFAARFVDFDGDGQQRLEAFLDAERLRPGRPPR